MLIDADNYLLELLRYIHLNPVRANMVSSPDDYCWSSHHAYLGLRDEPWVTTEFALAMFHGDLHHARESYQRFVIAKLHTSSPLLECNINDTRILGSDTFAATLLGEAWKHKSRQTMDDLINDACIEFSTTTNQLFSATRQRELTKIRAWIAHQAVTSKIASMSHVARLFGRSEAALRQSVKLHFNYP